MGKTKTSYVVTWRNGSTQTIRVPKKLAKDFSRLARAIDANENININDLIELVLENKVDTGQNT